MYLYIEFLHTLFLSYDLLNLNDGDYTLEMELGLNLQGTTFAFPHV